MLATKAPRFQKNDGQFDFRVSARISDRLVRGLQPWPGGFGNVRIVEDGKSDRVIRVAIEAGFPFLCEWITEGETVELGELIRRERLAKLIAGNDLERVLVCPNAQESVYTVVLAACMRYRRSSLLEKDRCSQRVHGGHFKVSKSPF